jgi:uncharacterized OB-fold protein
MMSATMRRCRKCGQLFNSYGEEFCLECTEELDEIFTKVQDYVYDHETASVMEISKALDIDGKIILGFIRDGSLELSEGSYALTCSRCKKPIPSGDFCDECKNKLSNLFENATHIDEPQPEKKKHRMHIRHK